MTSLALRARRPDRRPVQPPKAMTELSGLMAFINRDDENKEDYVRLGSEFEFTNRKTIAFKTKGSLGTEEFSFNDWSFKQLSRMLKIPSQYLASCKVVGRGSMQDQIQARMESRLSQQYMLRVRRQSEKIEGVSGVLRAVLPGGYVQFDNRHMLKAIQRAMGELGGDWRLEESNAHDPKSVEQSFHLRFVHNNKFMVGADDAHAMGFHAVTSEIGRSDVVIAALVWRLICSNGMLGWGDSDVLRLKHRNHERHEVFPQVHEAVLASVRQEAAVQDLLQRSYAEPVRDPEGFLLLMAKRMRVPEPVAESALEHLRNSSGDATRFNVMQAFTRAARELPMIERTEVEERVGGMMLGGGRWGSRRHERRLDLDEDGNGN